MKKYTKQYTEQIWKVLFFAAACTSVLAVAFICIFLFVNGIPAILEIGLFDFLAGQKWKPGNDIYGILPMILGSIYVTGGAILIGVPIGILTSIFMIGYCPKRLYPLLKGATQLLAGIPSVVYGFFGLVIVVPLISNLFDVDGSNMLTASIILGIMILPTIIGVTESALRAVPEAYYEGALALGATHTRSLFSIVLPAAKSGVMAAIVLGIGRAIGETMAVIMIAGNQPRMPAGILKGVRTLTSNIVLEMGYAADLHRGALIATAVVLFVFILIIQISLSIWKGGKRDAKN